MGAAAERIVPVSLELGGKSPSIVFPDANEDWVVDGIIAAMRFTRQSQSCTAGSRLFLHADIFDPFLDKLKDKAAALKIGDPLDEATDIGAIINEKQFRKVCSYVEDGLNQPKARLVMDGLPPKTGPLSEGYFTVPIEPFPPFNNLRRRPEMIYGFSKVYPSFARKRESRRNGWEQLPPVRARGRLWTPAFAGVTDGGLILRGSFRIRSLSEIGTVSKFSRRNGGEKDRESTPAVSR
jgi:Aldehyde dehydrogenase family